MINSNLEIHLCPTSEQHRRQWWQEYQRANPEAAAFIRREREAEGRSAVAEFLYLVPGSELEVVPCVESRE